MTQENTFLKLPEQLIIYKASISHDYETFSNSSIGSCFTEHGNISARLDLIVSIGTRETFTVSAAA